MSNGRRFDKGFWIRVGIIAILAMTILVVGFKLWVPLGKFVVGVYQWLTVTNEKDVTHHMYLLSATAQVLAALFALVFSITLIAAQFLTQYTRKMMRVIFHKWVIIYMIFFAFAVILPLWLLRKPTGNGSLLAISFGSLAVLLLIWFFLDMRKKIETTDIVTFHKNQGNSALRQKNIGVLSNTIAELGSTARKALKEEDLDIFKKSQRAISDFALSVETKYGSEQEEERNFIQTTFQNLQHLFQEVLDHPDLPFTMLLDLRQVSMLAINRRKWLTTQEVGSLFVNIENMSTDEESNHINQHRMSIVSRCLEYLHETTMKSLAEYKLELELNNVHLTLVELETNIYKKHLLTKKNEHFLKGFWGTIELTNVFSERDHLAMFVERYAIYYLFNYYDYFSSFNDENQIRIFIREITQIAYILARNIFDLYDELITIFASQMKKYADEMEVKKGEWPIIAHELYYDIAKLASIVLERGRFGLCRELNQKYFSVIATKKLIVRFHEDILSEMKNQLSYLIESKPSGFNDEWAMQFVGTFTSELNKWLVEKKDHNYIQSQWSEIEPLLNDLLVLAEKKKYPITMDHILFLYRSTGNSNEWNKGPLNRNELFRGEWKALAGHNQVGPEERTREQCRLIADELNKYQVLNEFRQVYENLITAKLDDKLLQNLQGVKHVFEEEAQKKKL